MAAKHPDRQIDAELWRGNLDKLANVHQGLLQSKYGDKSAEVRLVNDTARRVGRLVHRKLHVGLRAGLDWPLGLEDTAAEVEKYRLVVIAGSGGAGKTTLGQMVYNQLPESADVDRFAYVQLIQDPAMQHNMGPTPAAAVHTALGDLLQAINPHMQVPAATAERQGALSKILDRSQMLLLLDNVRDPQQLMELLPCLPAAGSRVLVTSRCSSDWGSIHSGAWHTFLMPRMQLEVAQELFQRVRGADTPADFKKIEAGILRQANSLPQYIVTAAQLLRVRDDNGAKVIPRKEQWQAVHDKEGASWASLLLKGLPPYKRQLLFDVAELFRGLPAQYALSYWRAKGTISMASSDWLECMPMLSVQQGDLVMHDIDYACIHQALQTRQFVEVVDSSRFCFLTGRDVNYTVIVVSLMVCGFVSFWGAFAFHGLIRTWVSVNAAAAAVAAQQVVGLLVLYAGIPLPNLGWPVADFSAKAGEKATSMVENFKVSRQLKRLPPGVLWLKVQVGWWASNANVRLADFMHLANSLLVLEVDVKGGKVKNSDLLGNFTRLEHLYLSAGPAGHALPDSICKLSNLRSLRLSVCECPELPSLRQLQHFKVVDLSRCYWGPQGVIEVPDGCQVLLPAK